MRLGHLAGKWIVDVRVFDIHVYGPWPKCAAIPSIYRVLSRRSFETEEDAKKEAESLFAKHDGRYAMLHERIPACE